MPLVGTTMKKQLRRRAAQRHDGRPCTEAWRSSRALSSSHGGRLSWADGSFMGGSGLERLRCSWRTTGSSSSFTKGLRRGESQAVWHTPLVLPLRDTSRYLTLRPACSTERVPGQSEPLYKETLSEKKEKRMK